MIFNTALPASGGSSVSGWTDVSTEFAAVLEPEAITEVFAITDGSFVYLSGMGIGNGVASTGSYPLPAAYTPARFCIGMLAGAFGASSWSGTPYVYVDPTSAYPLGVQDVNGEGFGDETVFTIIYPIAS